MSEGQGTVWCIIVTLGAASLYSLPNTVFGSGYWFVMEALGCDLGSVLNKHKVCWGSLQGR